ncbi:hypothetical protein SDC9_83247 [bioreactor metagenome]|uniref:Uncharacterized protein n=1 Tax=bioreactor metagenome TaxID=1076179 RepID=A0A644Z8N5_9ZZZZ
MRFRSLQRAVPTVNKQELPCSHKLGRRGQPGATIRADTTPISRPFRISRWARYGSSTNPQRQSVSEPAKKRSPMPNYQALRLRLSMRYSKGTSPSAKASARCWRIPPSRSGRRCSPQKGRSSLRSFCTTISQTCRLPYGQDFLPWESAWLWL